MREGGAVTVREGGARENSVCRKQKLGEHEADHHFNQQSALYHLLSIAQLIIYTVVTQLGPGPAGSHKKPFKNIREPLCYKLPSV